MKPFLTTEDRGHEMPQTKRILEIIKVTLVRSSQLAHQNWIKAGLVTDVLVIVVSRARGTSPYRSHQRWREQVLSEPPLSPWSLSKAHIYSLYQLMVHVWSSHYPSNSVFTTCVPTKQRFEFRRGRCAWLDSGTLVCRFDPCKTPCYLSSYKYNDKIRDI